MRSFRSILMYGFAIFAMFFGSGNLVFPLQIGQISSNSWFFGFLGLFLTGIVLPFFGLFVIKLHRGDYLKFFGEAGPVAAFLLPLFTLSLLGSFGVVPRCITVAYGGVEDFFPTLSLTFFSFFFSVATFLLCLKDTLMVKILGKWMSPILLMALLVLIGAGVLNAPKNLDITTSSTKALSQGFLTGYQTMDLFAAFFFSAFIFNQIQNAIQEKEGNEAASHHKSIIAFAIKPSVLGALFLAIIYLGFVFLGAHYAHLINDVEPEAMLPTIAKHTLGSSATFFIGIAMVLSCLTTAVALNNIYARYLCTLIKRENSTQLFPWVLALTTGVSFAMSLLDFRGIAAFLAPALEISYPGIIALTVLSIFVKEQLTLKKYTFYGITVLMMAEFVYRCWL